MARQLRKSLTDNPAVCFKGLTGGCFVGTGEILHDADGAAAELRVRGIEVDHQVAHDLTRAGERERGDQVEHELRGRASFEARGAGEHFWARVGQDGAVEERVVAISRIAG